MKHSTSHISRTFSLVTSRYVWLKLISEFGNISADKVTRLVTDIPDPEVPKTVEFKLFFTSDPTAERKMRQVILTVRLRGVRSEHLVQAALLRFEELLPSCVPLSGSLLDTHIWLLLVPRCFVEHRARAVVEKLGYIYKETLLSA